MVECVSSSQIHLDNHIVLFLDSVVLEFQFYSSMDLCQSESFDLFKVLVLKCLWGMPGACLRNGSFVP